MMAGAVVGGLLAYAFHAVGGRFLGEAGFAPVGVMWTVAFIVATVLFLPLEQWATRESALKRCPLSARGAPAIIVGAAAAAPPLTWWMASPLTEHAPIHALQMLVLVVGYGAFWVGKGVMQGERRFGSVGWLLCAEGAVRLAVGWVAAAEGWGGVGMGWAMAFAPWVIAAFGVRRRGERPPALRGGAFLWRYIPGAAASQVLVAGSPLAVALLGGSATQVGLAFMVLILFRAPLTLMYSLQGRLLASFARTLRQGGEGTLRLLGGRLWVISAVSAVAAGVVGYLAGPTVVRLLAGGDFSPTPMVAGLVAAATVAAVGVQLLAQILVAGSRTGTLAVAWVAGLAAGCLAIWLVPGGPVAVAAIGFGTGEAVALLVAGVAVRRPA